MRKPRFTFIEEVNEEKPKGFFNSNLLEPITYEAWKRKHKNITTLTFSGVTIEIDFETNEKFIKEIL